MPSTRHLLRGRCNVSRMSTTSRKPESSLAGRNDPLAFALPFDGIRPSYMVYMITLATWVRCLRSQSPPMRKGSHSWVSPGPITAVAIALTYALAALPALAQDRTCARMKALAVSATAGFPNLSGPRVAQDASGTTTAPIQDLVPLIGQCRLLIPAENGYLRAALNCETSLKPQAGPDVVKDTDALVSEFSKCLGASVLKQTASELNEFGSKRMHTWTLNGPEESPWILKFSLLEPGSQGGSVVDPFPGQLVMNLSSTDSIPNSSN